MDISQKDPQLNSRVYAGEALRQYIEESGVLAYKGRDCLEELDDYLRSREKRVLGLCGLHRTGRTSLLYQAIGNLGRYEDSVLVLCSEEDHMAELEQALSKMTYQYVFLDEVAGLLDFTGECGFFADGLVQNGKRVILTGGDGDELVLAGEGELLDKMKLLRVSYVPFREFQRFSGGSLEDYINFRSEGAEERIRGIAKKYAEGQDESGCLECTEKLNESGHLERAGESDAKDYWEQPEFSSRAGRILRLMDVLVELPEDGRRYRMVFTQPGLMRQERLQRDIIMTDMFKDPVVSGANIVTMYKSDGGEEFDIVLINKKTRRSVAIQVEDTDQREENQVRNLTDKVVCRELQEYFSCRLVGRYVFYHGKSGRAFKVQYVNCTQFLGRGEIFWSILDKLEGE